MCKKCLISYMKEVSAQVIFKKEEGEGGKITSVCGSHNNDIDSKLWFVATFANLFHEYCKEMARGCKMEYDDVEDLLRDFITPDKKDEDGDDSNIEVVHIKAENPKDAIKQIMETITKHIEKRKKEK